MSAFQQFAESVLVPVQLVLAMFGMGATLAAKDFADVFRQPRGLALGLGLQLLYVPLVALGFTLAFDLGPGWSVGLLLLACVPGGAASNLLTFLGKGNVPLSIAVTTTTTLGCVLSAPLLLSLFASAYLPEDFAFPALRIFRDILLFLLVPLGVGMLVHANLPKHSKRLSDWAIRASIVVVLIIAASSLGSGRIQLGAYGWTPPLVVIGFQLFLAFTVPHVTRLVGQSDADATALVIEIVVRNTGIALLLVQFFFPGTEENGQVLFAALFYAGTSTLVALPMLLLHRKGFSPALGRRRSAASANAPTPASDSGL